MDGDNGKQNIDHATASNPQVINCPQFKVKLKTKT